MVLVTVRVSAPLAQLAVVAVLMDPGAANPLIHNVWTHMPLDTADRVKLPAGAIDMNKLLPQDQRYYQFIGSLTTPPCTEGVSWLLMQQPITASKAQIERFGELFGKHTTARPVQPLLLVGLLRRWRRRPEPRRSLRWH